MNKSCSTNQHMSFHTIKVCGYSGIYVSNNNKYLENLVYQISYYFSLNKVKKLSSTVVQTPSFTKSRSLSVFRLLA